MEEKRPVISVIVPVYNVEPYLAEALDCITGQTFSDMEILCVNDGSTDGSPAILAEYAARDGRIRVLDQENRGLSGARNRGLDEARGEFVYYFDSDDLLERDAFEALVPRMRDDALDLLFFNVEAFADGEVPEKILASYEKYYRRENSYDGVMTGTELMTRMKANDEYLVGVWAQFARRTFLEEHGLRFEDGILYEDNLYTFQACLAAGRAGYLDRIFFRRRLRGGSLTQTKKTFAHVYGYFRTHLKMADVYREALRESDDRALLQSGEAAVLVAETLRNARSYYAGLDAAERARSEELPEEEQAFFAVYVKDHQKLAGEKNAAVKARKKAEQERDAAKKQAEDLQKQIGKIKDSKSYLLGEKLASPVRKARKLKRGGDADAGKAVSAGPPAADPADGVPQPAEGAKTAAGQARSACAAWFFGSPSHGNLGDHMIAEASLELIGRLCPGLPVREIPRDRIPEGLESLRAEVRPEDPVFLIGGGNLGNYWPVNESVREEIIRAFPENRKIVLPQSIQFTDDEAGREALARAKEVYSGEKLLLVCRGAESLAFAKEQFSCPCVLAPDTVMGASVPVYWKAAGPRNGVLLCLRQDKESALDEGVRARIGAVLKERCAADAPGERSAAVERIDTVLPYPVDPKDRRRELAAVYRKFSGAEAVVTDRLHGMVFAAQTGTPCVVLSNDHHKIRECYAWLEDLPYIALIGDPGELPAALDAVTAAVQREYPLRRLREAFSAIRPFME